VEEDEGLQCWRRGPILALRACGVDEEVSAAGGMQSTNGERTGLIELRPAENYAKLKAAMDKSFLDILTRLRRHLNDHRAAGR